MSKRTRFLITQSLLGSWLYQYNAYDIEQAHKDFLSTLNREQRKPTKAILDGIQFENMVTAYCEGAEPNKEHKWFHSIKECGDVLKGAQFQVPVYKDKIIDGIPFLLYGRIDALKAGIIYDLKFSHSYEPGKYLASPQHPMYFECCPEAVKFIYIISNGSEMYQESYSRTDSPTIDSTIMEFIHYLEFTGLDKIYVEKWKAK